MLKLLRNQKLVKKIFYVLAIIIIPSFILWGSASVIGDKQSRGYAGKIFGKNISYDEYRSTLQAWRNQMKMKFGDKADQVEKIFDANEAVWDRLILRYGTKKMGIKVTNEELTQSIASLPFLQKDKKFDPEIYNLFLRYSLNTPARIFEEDTREMLKFQKIFNHITKDVTVSDEEIRERYKQENEQIKVKYIPSLNQDAQKDAGVNDDELRSYYEENKEGLKISIQVNLSYIGEDYPQDATNEQKETINNKFKEISEFIKNGNGLAKAKDKFGLQIQETGFISLGDPLLGIDWTPDDLVKLFNLNPDGITDVIQTPRGPYIFQLKEKRTDYLPSFEEVKENLKTPLVKEKSKELAKSKIENYHSQLAKKKQENPNAEPVKISEELNLPIKETDFFNRYSPVLDIGLSEEFNEASFNLADGQISDVIELAQGYFIIISISERKPIDEAELEKAKEGLKNTLLSEKKNEVFEQFYANLKQKANLIDYVSLQQNQ
ncbi:MAG: SurA N-terminal domain-containing protein [Candidatus Omnitrophica bacterium]|nr:SurA N-terminal domain-containing protein [Candidatus Omnitrophota bacterium]